MYESRTEIMEEIIIHSLTAYRDFVEKYKGTHLFRGQANSEWSISPNIFRYKEKLEQECEYINRDYTHNSLELLSHILKLQHYGEGTRLCDLTINPYVGLYFSIEDDSNDDFDSAVFIIEDANSIAIDSIELKILLLLTVNKIETVDQLMLEIEKHIGVTFDRCEVISMITKNYVISHNIKLSYTNTRALLQGGTGLLFGFGVEDNIISRRNEKILDSIVKKVIIPKYIKPLIRKYLYKFGFNKPILYDVIMKSYKQIEYRTFTNRDGYKPWNKKIKIDIILSDIIFVEEDVKLIMQSVFDEAKASFGDDCKIWLYTYFDEEDRRSANWIARNKNNTDFNSFIMDFNKDYHSKRMMYFNNEISIDTIFAVTEPVVELCTKICDEFSNTFNSFVEGELTMESYSTELNEIHKTIYKAVMNDLQNIYHGGREFHDYYDFSNEYCVAAYNLIDEQRLYLERNENIGLLKWSYDKCMSYYSNSYKKYVEEKRRIIKLASRLE